jgi:anti-sigma factor RsiW
MSIPDETLMAYADDELEPAQRAEVEAAVAADPQLAERVARHRALRKKLNAAFDPVLLETVPDAMVAQIRGAPASGHSAKPAGAASSTAVPGATITDLRRVRAARAAEAKEAAAAVARRGDTPRPPWTWFEWTAVAASLAIGAVVAHLALNSPDASRIGTVGGQLVAQADLADALSAQLAIDQPPDAPVQIGVSFKSKSGDTCRTFTLKEQSVLGGLACRQGNDWRVELLAEAAPGTNAPGGYKPAGGSMPAAVLTAVEQKIEGDALDASGEAAARARGWQ